MSRILILANNDVGLYKFRIELIEELLNQGNDVYISLPNGEFIQPLIDINCKFVNTDVDRRGINPITDFKLVVGYLKIIKKVKPNMVITYTIKPNIYGGIVSRIMKVQYSINITGLGTAFQNDGILKKIIIFLYKLSCKKAKVVFFENEENQRIFIDNKIVKEENTCKLNGAGVNLKVYKFCNYPEDTGKIHFLFIGRVMKEKGINELFEAAEYIKKEYTNVYFDIVGPLEDDYKDRINELQDSNIINYHGYQSDVRSFIKRSHCLILPSYHEGMANTLLESAAMGRPLITSNIFGCKEAVANEDNGYLVNVKDSKDLFDKIKKFIELPYEEKIKMSYNSRRLMEKVFDKSKIVKKTINKIVTSSRKKQCSNTLISSNKNIQR
ncbi:MAG: glycosyltransferase family 4 protein [Clostridiaceae bacterium]